MLSFVGLSFYTQFTPHAMAFTLRQSLYRFTRKHSVALISLAVPLFILFFPSMFMGRILSPNDVYFNYDPWRSVQTVHSQNPIINDPPTSWYTLMSLLQDDPAAFHWNRWVASGIPGYGALAAAVLSPFVAIPVLFLPLSLVYGGIITLKIVVPFIGGYLWLRQSRAGRTGAALGAVVLALAGMYSVWWLWQGTNATALYPWMMWMIRRSFDRRRVPLLWWLLLGASFLLSGYPATIIYGCWIGAAYLLVLSIRARRVPYGLIVRGTAATGIVLLLLLPSLVSFTRFLDRTGYLDSRRGVASTLAVFPPEHLSAFVSPFRLGDPIAQKWTGPRQAANNFVETTVYLGWLTLPLILLGLLRRGAELRWFWAGLLALLIGGLFFIGPIAEFLARLPGIGYSPLGRLRVLLPLAAAPLAAYGAAELNRLLRTRGSWLRSRALLAVTVLLATDLGLFAAYFYPYVRRSVAEVPETPITQWLHARQGPFRVLPTFDMYWPNTAELARIEDIRSHFGSESQYRRLMQRIDPQSWGGSGTVLQVNGLTLDPADPLLPLLNVRYILEQPSIDILRWRVAEKTTPEAEPAGNVTIGARSVVRSIGAPEQDVWAVELTAWPAAGSPGGVLIAELRRASDNSIIQQVTRTRAQLQSTEKVYVPLPRSGVALMMSVGAEGMLVRMPAQREEPSKFHIGWVRTPLVHADTLPDGRVFELLSSTPRYSAVWELETRTFDQMIEDPSIDFRRTAVVTEPREALHRKLSSVPEELRRVHMRLLEWTGSSERLVIESAVPSLIIASEKLVPELSVELDGRSVSPIPVNGLFWGVPVDAGTHELRVTRTIGPGWLPVSGAGLLLAVAGVWLDRRTARRRG